MNLRKPIGYGVLGAVLLATGIAAWQVHTASELHSRVYRVGFGEDPPFQFRGDGGTPTGVAIEIVKEAARRRGIHLEWVQPEHFGASAIEQGEADLWVLMTDLPERHRSMYISEPYLTMERCFVVLKGSGFGSARDLEHARIGYRQSWSSVPAKPGLPAVSSNAAASSNAGVSSNADELYVRAHFPSATAVPLPIERPGTLVQPLAEHAVDAELVNKTVMAERLASEGGHAALDLINAPDAIGPLSLGASFDAQGAARAIRGEMDRMAEDGGMGRVTEPWGFFQTASLNVVGQLADAKRTNRILVASVAGLIGAMALIWILMGSWRRQCNAVRDLTSRLISAQEEERMRIARDLHDDINQQLAVLSMSLGRLNRSSAASEPLGPQRIDERQWEGLLSLVDQIRRAVHRISHALHPELLELSGLRVALEALRRDVAAASGMAVTLDPGPLAETDGEPVPAEIALCLYRVAQEALQNAVKHSESREVRISITRTARSLDLSVSDSGIGVSSTALETRMGLGLVSMQERARLLNGSLRIDSRTEGPRRGTTVTLSVPLPQAAKIRFLSAIQRRSFAAKTDVS